MVESLETPDTIVQTGIAPEIDTISSIYLKAIAIAEELKDAGAVKKYARLLARVGLSELRPF